MLVGDPGGGGPKWPTRYSTSVSEAEAGVYSKPRGPLAEGLGFLVLYLCYAQVKERRPDPLRPGTALGLNPHRSGSSKKPREETLSGKSARRSLFDFYCASLEFRVCTFRV